MCHGHSHILCEITGHVRVGETDMLEVRMQTPLEMRLPYGEKLIKSKHTALWVPVSPLVPLPASMRQVMAVCFTPLYYTVQSDMMHMPGLQLRQQTNGAIGPTASNTTDTYLAEVSNDDETPW